MVRKCEICGKDEKSHPDLSFHRLPFNMERRRIWASLLGWTSIITSKKMLFICSDHFNPNDFEIRADRKKYLKPDANPLPIHSAFQIQESSDSTNTDSSVISQDVHNQTQSIGAEDLTTSLVNISDTNEAKLEASCNISSFSSSTTLTASEIEVSNMEFVEPTGQNVPRNRKRKRNYFGDLSSSDFSTPEKRRQSILKVRRTITKQRTKIRSLQTKVRRQKLRISSLKSLVSLLNDKYRLSEGSQHTILASIPKTAGTLFKRMLGGATRQKYDPCLRSFALTLAFYSPKAYNYVRKTFNDSLPHLGTLSKWYRSVDGSPGFTKESLVALKLRQSESSTPIICNLVMDEMSIRQQIEWTGQKFTGYVDIGTNLDSDTLPEAREVLVFMVVCIHSSWKVPVGYFLVNGLSATEKSELVKKCLEFVNESGVVISSLTFDGTTTNISMAEKLGVNLSDPSNLNTNFIHPITKKDVFILLDACHMIKLVRNCFASQSGLKNGDKRDIRWDFIKKLVEMQYQEGLHAATKVRLRHLQWSREKMKVRLATQTLSKSVSDALKFLCDDLKCVEFQGSEATSEFILYFNDLFDILNSRNLFTKYYFKKPFSSETCNTFLNFFERMKEYILHLTLNDIPVLQSPRKTGFLGLLVCMESTTKMYFKYVVEEKYLKYILTYKLSQDHLELFFGAIRSKGGYNNNPTARQFEASYKRMLIRSEIAASNSGNAVNLESVAILTCGSGRKITLSDSGRNLEEDEGYKSFIMKSQTDIENYNFNVDTAWNLSPYVEDIVGYISGFIVKGLQRCVTCPKCLNLLENQESMSQLQKQKTYGKLIKASGMVINLCKQAEKYFRFFHKTSNIYNPNAKNLYNILVNQTMQTLELSTLDAFGDHLYDDDPIDGHSIQLVKMILKNFFKLRIHHETRKNLDQTRQSRSRSLLTKTILFRNE